MVLREDICVFQQIIFRLSLFEKHIYLSTIVRTRYIVFSLLNNKIFRVNSLPKFFQEINFAINFFKNDWGTMYKKKFVKSNKIRAYYQFATRRPSSAVVEGLVGRSCRLGPLRLRKIIEWHTITFLRALVNVHIDNDVEH